LENNGQIEGQAEYMIAVPDWHEMNFEEYPEEDFLTDLDEIEDETLRALAQEYADKGYTIEDPAVDLEYGYGFGGDGEYMFSNGFYAYIEDGLSLKTFAAYKMNEVLFDTFLVGYFHAPDYEMTDDGNIVRYSSGTNYVEFNRETGVGCLYNEFYFERRAS